MSSQQNAPEDQKGVYFEEINLEKELLSEEENSITTYSPGVPKLPSKHSAKEEHLTFNYVTRRTFGTQDRIPKLWRIPLGR